VGVSLTGPVDGIVGVSLTGPVNEQALRVPSGVGDGPGVHRDLVGVCGCV